MWVLVCNITTIVHRIIVAKLSRAGTVSLSLRTEGKKNENCRKIPQIKVLFLFLTIPQIQVTSPGKLA